MDKATREGDSFIPVAERVVTFDQAVEGGWVVISMKNDWKRVFAFDP